jgi:hypothetical protein
MLESLMAWYFNAACRVLPAFVLAIPSARNWAQQPNETNNALTKRQLTQKADFDDDPRWDGHRNRLLPDPPPRVRQSFGLRTSSISGDKSHGEIGGWIQRSITPAWFAKSIPEKSLNDKLIASGTFAVKQAEGGSGMLFGWFNDKSRGWRTPNSLAFRLDGNGGKYWVFYEYGTRNWLTGGGGCFEGDRYQTTKTTPLAADGTVHRWSLSYDPDANNGDGLVVFVLDGKEYRRPLEPGHKADGATFNRFGMFNQQITGDGLEVYFGDLSLDGKAVDLSKPAQWSGLNHERQYADRALRPLHDFGYFETQRAGGKAKGEIGGIVWRDERPAYYAEKVGPLSLEHRLRASGKLAFTGAGSDSAVYIGWFDAASKKNKTTPEHVEPQYNVLGIIIEGPSRIGHYFRPGYCNSKAEGGAAASGPIIRPDGQPHEWSIDYDPNANGGNGRITIRFDGKEQTLDLKPGHKKAGAAFDRFGILNCQSGGHFVEVYLDDLEYTAKPNAE